MRYRFRKLLLRLAAGPPILEFLLESFGWPRSPQQGLRRSQQRIQSVARFSIRDLLWLTVVVALAVGWWNDRRRIDSEAARLEQATSAYQSKLDQVRSEQTEEAASP